MRRRNSPGKEPEWHDRDGRIPEVGVTRSTDPTDYSILPLPQEKRWIVIAKQKKMSERVTNNIGFNSNSSKAASDNAHNVPRVSWIGIHETDSSDFFYSRDSFITHKNRKCLLGLIIGWCNSLKYDKLLLSYLYTPGFEQLCRRMGQ